MAKAANVVGDSTIIKMPNAEILVGKTAKEKGLTLHLPGNVSSTSLEFPKAISWVDWRMAALLLGQVGSAVNWWLGDALLFGSQKFGETYAQVASEIGLSEARVQAVLFVAQRIQPIVRRKELSWSHHREVAPLPESMQIEWLNAAAIHKLSVAELRMQLKAAGLQPGKHPAVEHIPQPPPSLADLTQINVVGVCPACGEKPATMLICVDCGTALVDATKALVS